MFNKDYTNNRQDQDDQFDGWVGQWEKAMKDGIFDDVKPNNPGIQNTPDFFGQYPSVPNKGIQSIDAEYWKQVYKMSNNQGEAPDVASGDEGMMTEHTKQSNAQRLAAEHALRLAGVNPKLKKKLTEAKVGLPDWETIMKPSDTKGDMKAKVKAVADSPNPQHPTSYGPDNVDDDGRTRVSAGWAAEERIKEIHDMKVSIYELECKMSDSDGLNESKVKSVQQKINALKKQIDDLSNEFQGDWASSHVY